MERLLLRVKSFAVVAMGMNDYERYGQQRQVVLEDLPVHPL
jgi:hypothetical protein|tara:strand:+ start:2608 stop:2730 length:123 start_codon:yes stop_codon:yes gene_type:complete